MRSWLWLRVALAVGYFAFSEFRSSDVGTLWPSRNAFVARQLPFATTQELLDIGVTDANGDDRLDIFTTNHNSRQSLLVADGQGGYRDMLSAWGLDQNLDFPGLEITPREPEVAAPGVYLYWKGRNTDSQFTLVIRAHRIADLGRLDGTLRTYSSIQRYEGAAFAVQPPEAAPGSDGAMRETLMKFSTDPGRHAGGGNRFARPSGQHSIRQFDTADKHFCGRAEGVATIR